MSIQAVAWVLEHSTTKGAERLVLLSLANHAGTDDGECWPSVERIAAEANITAVHAKRTLAALTTGGHIARSINKAPDDRVRPDRRTNLYRILDGGAQKLPPWLEREAQRRADGGNNGARTGGTSEPRRGASEVPPNHQVEPSPEPSAEPLAMELVTAGDFGFFWKLYPSKAGKAAAEKAWPRACRKHSPTAICDAAQRYADDPNRDPAYTKHASTWLNGECWNDPPLPSRTGLGAARAKEQRTADAINNVFGGGQRQIGDGQ